MPSPWKRFKALFSRPDSNATADRQSAMPAVPARPQPINVTVAPTRSPDGTPIAKPQAPIYANIPLLESPSRDTLVEHPLGGQAPPPRNAIYNKIPEQPVNGQPPPRNAIHAKSPRPMNADASHRRDTVYANIPETNKQISAVNNHHEAPKAPPNAAVGRSYAPGERAALTPRPQGTGKLPAVEKPPAAVHNAAPGDARQQCILAQNKLAAKPHNDRPHDAVNKELKERFLSRK